MSYYDFDYFGEKTSIKIEPDINGNIYSIEILLKDSIEKIKPALEDKISKENGRTVKFLCSTSKIQPDASAELITEKCTIAHPPQVLTLSETKIKSTVSNRLPIYTRHINLTDTKLKAEENSRKNEERAADERKIDSKKKSDI